MAHSMHNTIVRQNLLVISKTIHRLLSNLSKKEDNFIPDVIKKRYHFKHYEELCHRVSNITPNLKQDIFKTMIEKKFSPAGNTLLAGIRSIRPNCSILPTVTDNNLDEIKYRASKIWKHHTGIGFDLSGCTDPVKILYELAELNDSIKFDDRCQRGNMAVVSARHPKAIDFARCKTKNPEKIFNFNISIAFENANQFENARKLATKERRGILWVAAESAWKCGCPGIVFLDRFLEASCEKELSLIDPTIEPISTTVPCGEQGMRPNESCNLGVINLFKHIQTNNQLVDLESIRSTVRIAVRFLDQVVDQIEIDDTDMKQRTKQLRRIGLGVTGLADCLKSAGLSYNSVEGLNYAESLAHTIASTATEETKRLAKQLGSYHSETNRRNVTVTCCQPTGNITLLLGTRGFAIEPLMEEATALSWQDHLKMQVVWQKYFENAVSKTVNLPSSATVNDVLNVFIHAYQTNVLKGVAVYRDSSRDKQPMSLQEKNCNGPNGTCNL